MTTFNKAKAQSLSLTAVAELKAWAEKNGVKVQFAGGSFNQNELTMKLKVTTADPKAAEDANRAEFNRLCRSFGLQPEDYRKSFSVYGRTYQLRGFAPRRRKYPIRCWCFDRCKEVLIQETPEVIRVIRSAPSQPSIEVKKRA